MGAKGKTKISVRVADAVGHGLKELKLQRFLH
jgi:hypothetical protein